MRAKDGLQGLAKCFEKAKEYKMQYIAVEVEMEGFPQTDVIVTQFENYDKKLEFYKNSYDENLNHKYSKESVKIVGYTYGDTFDELELNLLL